MLDMMPGIRANDTATLMPGCFVFVMRDPDTRQIFDDRLRRQTTKFEFFSNEKMGQSPSLRQFQLDMRGNCGI